MSYKDTVFSLYGSYVSTQDSYHDAEGKGLFERFNEILGQDLDDEVITAIQGLLDEMIVPATMQEKFIALLMSQIGFTPVMNISREKKTKLLGMLRTLYDRRGLENCQNTLLSFMGITSVEHVGKEVYTVRGLDSTLSLDSGRTLDSTKSSTFYYDFKLKGTEQLSESLIESIMSIIWFNLPYYVILMRVYYNDELVFVNGITKMYMEKEYVAIDYVEDTFEMNDIYVN